MDRAEAFRGLADTYAIALRLRDEGVELDTVARVLGVEPEVVDPLLKLADAKLAGLSADAREEASVSDSPRGLSAPEDQSARPMTDCPYCGESILAVAAKCRHCGEFLLTDRPSATTRVIRSPSGSGDPTSPDAPAAAPEPSESTPSPALGGSLPSTSMDRADSVFENFSVSGFSRGSKPASYVEAADGPPAVRSAHRRMMTQLDRLSAAGIRGGGITVAMPESDVATLLPSLNADNGTVELTDVLNVIAQCMRGAEFYATGQPVLNRLALQTRATELIAALKEEAIPHDEKVASRQEGATR